MAYATQADVIEIYGERLLKQVAPLNDDGTVKGTSVNRSLDRASSTVDSYLSRRYTVPLTSPSYDVKQKTIDIAMYTMALSLDQQTSEHRLRYEDALAWLKDVATGKAGIGNDELDDKPIAEPDRRVGSAFLLRS